MRQARSWFAVAAMALPACALLAPVDDHHEPGDAATSREDDASVTADVRVEPPDAADGGSGAGDGGPEPPPDAGRPCVDGGVAHLMCCDFDEGPPDGAPWPRCFDVPTNLNQAEIYLSTKQAVTPARSLQTIGQVMGSRARLTRAIDAPAGARCSFDVYAEQMPVSTMSIADLSTPGRRVSIQALTAQRDGGSEVVQLQLGPQHTTPFDVTKPFLVIPTRAWSRVELDVPFPAAAVDAKATLRVLSGPGVASISYNAGVSSRAPTVFELGPLVVSSRTVMFFDNVICDAK